MDGHHDGMVMAAATRKGTTPRTSWTFCKNKVEGQ